MISAFFCYEVDIIFQFYGCFSYIKTRISNTMFVFQYAMRFGLRQNF